MRVLSDHTAERLRRIVAQTTGTKAALPGSGKTYGRPAVFVRCASAVAAGGGSGSGSDPSAQCYPGVIVDPRSDQTTQPELGAVWLTLLLDNTTAAGVPVAGRVYECLLSGLLDIGGDTRPRAFGAVGPAGSSPPPPPPPPPPPITTALPCSGSGSDCQGWGVMYDCDDQANLDNDVLDFDVYHFDPVGHDTPTECGGTNPAVGGYTGADAQKFLDSNAVCEFLWCCPEVFPDGPAVIPAGACITLTNGTGAYAGLTPTASPASWDGFGYPIAYGDAVLSITGKLRMNLARSPAGWYFAGEVVSTAADPADPTYSCGCDTIIPAGSADANGITQTVLFGPVVSGPTAPRETLRVTTPCGSIDIILVPGPSCSPPPPPPPPGGCCAAEVSGAGAPVLHVTAAVTLGAYTLPAGTYIGAWASGVADLTAANFVVGDGHTVWLNCWGSDIPCDGFVIPGGVWHLTDGASGCSVWTSAALASAADCGPPISITGTGWTVTA